MVGSAIFRGAQVHETVRRDVTMTVELSEALHGAAADRRISVDRAIGEAIRDAVSPRTPVPEMTLIEHESKFRGYVWYTLEMSRSYSDTIDVRRSGRGDQRSGEQVILDAVKRYTGESEQVAAGFVHSKEPLMPMWRGH